MTSSNLISQLFTLQSNRMMKLLGSRLQHIDVPLEQFLMNSDDVIIKAIQKSNKVISVTKKNPNHQKQIELRSKRHADRAHKLIELYLNSPHIRYLDIGCADGSTTMALSKLIGQNRTITTMCIDPYVRVSDAPIVKYNNIPNQSIDLITVLMTLHHHKNLHHTMNQIQRICKKGSIVLVKEHDCRNDIDRDFIFVEHMIYMTTRKEVEEYLKTHQLHSVYWWIKLFRKYKFNFITKSYVRGDNNKKLPTRSVYLVFSKS